MNEIRILVLAPNQERLREMFLKQKQDFNRNSVKYDIVSDIELLAEFRITDGRKVRYIFKVANTKITIDDSNFRGCNPDMVHMDELTKEIEKQGNEVLEKLSSNAFIKKVKFKKVKLTEDE